MRTTTAALALAGVLFAPEALAIDDPYMWGVGPRVGTIVVPGKYPITFPTKVENYNFIDQGKGSGCATGEFFDDRGNDLCDNEKRDVDPDTGEPLYHTLEQVRTDVNFGGDFVFYLNKQYRVGALGYVGMGKRYLDIAVMPKVDKILLEDQIDVYAGGGIGFGFQRFSGVAGAEKLKVPYFPVRANVGALTRTPNAAFQLGVYAQSSVPGNQSYVSRSGEVYESVGTPLALFSYLSAGIEFTTYFGDFEPPKKKKGGKKKGGKK
ncbi:MAG: hypothetical protein D6798_03985, partial [Deltaproteobacteria bacterium]